MINHIARALALLVAIAGLATFTQPAQAFDDRDCGDFATQAGAQTFFNNAGGGDPHGLDADGDGRACDSLPCPCGVRNNPNPNPGPTLYRETGNVVKVIDGDTLRVRLKSGPVVDVRLLGINTPERGRCGAKDATANLRKLAPVRSTVDMVSDRSQAAKDRYGRLLRYVAKRRGYKDLSYRQAFNGYTKRYVFGGKPVARDGQYVRAIAQARNNDRGLWNSCW